MTLLHEILAVEGELKAAAERAMGRARKVFTSGQLLGMHRTYRPLDEEGETFPDEEQLLGTTVGLELDSVREAFGAWLDVSLQKEITNRDATAKISIQDLYWELPATALLNLESKLADLRKLIDAIPTNDPAKRWEWNEDMEPPCYVSNPVVSFRTKKEIVHQVKYEATPEHPAQVHTYSQDTRVGEYETVSFSGALNASEKRAVLRRVETLQRVVKAARMRANQAEVEDFSLADKLFGYIFGG